MNTFKLAYESVKSARRERSVEDRFSLNFSSNFERLDETFELLRQQLPRGRKVVLSDDAISALSAVNAFAFAAVCESESDAKTQEMMSLLQSITFAAAVTAAGVKS